MDHQQATDLIHDLEVNDIIIALRDHGGASYLDELPHSPHDRATLHAAAALIGALREIETMICQKKKPRKISGLQTYWRPEAA